MSESTTARPARLAGRGANDDASGVTLTVAELSAAIRLGDSPEETAQVKRLLELSLLWPSLNTRPKRPKLSKTRLRFWSLVTSMIRPWRPRARAIARF